jgi:tRNA pseudouridine(55) synthase
MSVHHTEKDETRQLRLKRIRSLSTISNTPLSDTDGQFLVYKERGETLAMLLERFRAVRQIPVSVPITYAGRLDPMAEGIVLLLVGMDRYKKDSLLGLVKTYEVEILFGISTDTQDILGVVTSELYTHIDMVRLKRLADEVRTIEELPYPLYSSAIVNGKPLFVHTRAGTTVDIPTKKVTISESVLLHTRVVPVELIAREAIEDIGKVEGDFRQPMIMKQWQSYIHSHRDKEVLIATIRITASSGTYMRSIAEWLGKQVGVPALAYKIKRTKLGDHTLK